MLLYGEDGKRFSWVDVPLITQAEPESKPRRKYYSTRPGGKCVETHGDRFVLSLRAERDCIR